ncbi:hypothetical protein [Seonamhaeicola maritimus]|uniref:Uncharacterized protein n=1 Tax=Seonamhaeicola maritimus TaxID=2591822 RepID=A0A5C7GME2_9FLAO|nr:hypothetical protein [Seonamhaeicola maritimus]TXG39430.1 hypothetical protein FUA22_06030 [Seonamhaeicola maritimus]
MRKLLFVLFSIGLIGFNSCDDGDIIDFNLDFDDEFQACDGINGLTLYKIKNDPSESLSIFISNFTKDELLAVEENDSLIIENKAVDFIYRTYTDESISNLFCSDIPANVNIEVDEESPDSKVDVLTVLTEDDNDGIPAELEDINGNGNLKDDDTDGDGIPNYKDADDDGDNVLTKDEEPDPNEDGDLSDALDTDNDNIPDYLDTDDDGDGVDTRDEENASQDQNPGNDITIEAAGADYLNPEVATNIPATAFRLHSYKKTYSVSVTVKDISINGAKITTLSFGILNDGNTSDTESLTPDFN